MTIMIANCYTNILEASGVSLEAGTEDPSFPLWRLYDRNIGKLFKGTAAETMQIKVYQGATPVAIDRLLIPDGHNLEYATSLKLEGSDDDFAADIYTALDTAHTNTLASPNDFSTADWTKVGGTTATATLITFFGYGNPCAIYASNSYSAGDYIFAVDLKAKTAAAVVNIRGDRGTDSAGTNVDVTTDWQTFYVQCSTAGVQAFMYAAIFAVSGDKEIYARNAELYIGILADQTDFTIAINKPFESATKAYWRLTITAPTEIPQIPEMFLSPTYTWERNPARPSGPFDPVFNVQNIERSGGQDRFLVLGQEKRVREYTVPSCTATQKTNILALNAAWAASKPFWLCDSDGTWIFGKLTKKINLRETAYETYAFDFSFLEVIPG